MEKFSSSTWVHFNIHKYVELFPPNGKWGLINREAYIMNERSISSDSFKEKGVRGEEAFC